MPSLKRFLNKWLLSILGLTVTLTSDLLTSKSNQFIFFTNCTQVVNLVKFSPAFCTTSCFQTLGIWSHADRRTPSDSQNTECLQWQIVSEGITRTSSSHYCLAWWQHLHTAKYHRHAMEKKIHSHYCSSQITYTDF